MTIASPLLTAPTPLETFQTKNLFSYKSPHNAAVHINILLGCGRLAQCNLTQFGPQSHNATIVNSSISHNDIPATSLANQSSPKAPSWESMCRNMADLVKQQEC